MKCGRQQWRSRNTWRVTSAVIGARDFSWCEINTTPAISCLSSPRKKSRSEIPEQREYFIDNKIWLILWVQTIYGRFIRSCKFCCEPSSVFLLLRFVTSLRCREWWRHAALSRADRVSRLLIGRQLTEERSLLRSLPLKCIRRFICCVWRLSETLTKQIAPWNLRLKASDLVPAIPLIISRKFGEMYM